MRRSSNDKTRERDKRFIMGMSVLTAYIYYTGNLNMHDINISAEQFMCDLLNILYNMDLKMQIMSHIIIRDMT